MKEKNISQKKLNYIRKIVVNLIKNVYLLPLLFPLSDKKLGNRLREFDNQLKKYEPDLYYADYRKFVKLMRITKFRTWKFIALLKIIKMKLKI